MPLKISKLVKDNKTRLPYFLRFFESRESAFWEAGEACDIKGKFCFNCYRKIRTDQHFRDACTIPLPNRSQYPSCVVACSSFCHDTIIAMATKAGMPDMKNKEFYLIDCGESFKVNVICEIPKCDDKGPLVYVKGVRMSGTKRHGPKMGIQGWVPVEDLKRVKRVKPVKRV